MGNSINETLIKYTTETYDVYSSLQGNELFYWFSGDSLVKKKGRQTRYRLIVENDTLVMKDKKDIKFSLWDRIKAFFGGGPTSLNRVNAFLQEKRNELISDTNLTNLEKEILKNFPKKIFEQYNKDHLFLRIRNIVSLRFQQSIPPLNPSQNQTPVSSRQREAIMENRWDDAFIKTRGSLPDFSDIEKLVKEVDETKIPLRRVLEEMDNRDFSIMQKNEWKKICLMCIVKSNGSTDPGEVYSLLMLAIRVGDQEIVKTLLTKGEKFAGPYSSDREINHPIRYLYTCCTNFTNEQKFPILEELVNAGSDPLTVSDYEPKKNMPLVAIFDKDIQAACWILDKINESSTLLNKYTFLEKSTVLLINKLDNQNFDKLKEFKEKISRMFPASFPVT